MSQMWNSRGVHIHVLVRGFVLYAPGTLGITRGLPFFSLLFFFILRCMGKSEAYAPTLPRIR